MARAATFNFGANAKAKGGSKKAAQKKRNAKLTQEQVANIKKYLS